MLMIFASSSFFIISHFQLFLRSLSLIFAQTNIANKSCEVSILITGSEYVGLKSRSLDCAISWVFFTRMALL